MFCSKCGKQITPGEKFCSKCGNPLSVSQNSLHNQNVSTNNSNTFNTSNSFVQPNLNNNYQQSYVNPSTDKDNKNKLFMGLCIGIGLFLFIFILSHFIRGSNEKYYFDTNPSKPDNEVVSQVESTTKRGQYETVIIYDNTYSGVKIKKDNDAIDLIVKDSVKQKGNCPKEIKNIEDEIINNYGITAVNLCEMDVDFARELGNVFKKIYDEYPSVRGYITNLVLVNVSMRDNYIAAFMPVFNFATSDSTTTYPWVIKTQILLNTSYFLNKERLEASVTDGSSTGHFPKNSSIYSPVAHELGHYLSFLAMMRNYNLNSILLVDSSNVNAFYSLYDDFGKGNYSLTMINEAYQRFVNDTNSTMSLDEWRGTISNYALAKDNNGEYIYDETIAESFHDVYLNGENASEASKYVVSVLREKLGS